MNVIDSCFRVSFFGSILSLELVLESCPTLQRRPCIGKERLAAATFGGIQPLTPCGYQLPYYSDSPEHTSFRSSNTIKIHRISKEQEYHSPRRIPLLDTPRQFPHLRHISTALNLPPFHPLHPHCYRAQTLHSHTPPSVPTRRSWDQKIHYRLHFPRLHHLFPL